jgi:glyoxylase-like metal-dependent hydrolase (beta-lactamase superfamily II)
MRLLGFKNVIESIRDGLHQIITQPSFAIGQRAFLVKTDSGNVLWDCVTYLDDKTISAIKALGGIEFIAISHPHYYSSIVEWSEAFGNAPIYIHNLDKMWVQRSSNNITYWRGRATSPLRGAKIINLGGHFDGSSVLYLHGGEFDKGVLLSGDTIYVVMDRRWASFMYSYPNHIPLPARKVKTIAARIKPYRFEDLYSGFEGREIIGGADLAVQMSSKRYIEHLN